MPCGPAPGTHAVSSAELRTERLLLRPWRDGDEPRMAAINRDPEVTRYLNRPTDEAAVEMFYGLLCDHWSQHGFGLWALESLEPGLEGAFLGFAGVMYPGFIKPIAHRPELGWRLARAAWGRGLATEAAAAAHIDAIERLGLKDFVSIIHPDNLRSQRVATKLGMSVERQIFNPVLRIDTDVWAFAPERDPLSV